jgi:TolB-like protein
LVNALKKIEGVEIIEIHSYYVSIDKGLAFDWWRIEEEIEQTIRYVLSGTPNIETIKLLNGI